MRNLEKILLFFVLQYSTTLSLWWPRCDIFAEFYPFDCGKDLPKFHTTESSLIENPDPGCPAGQSLISRNDITNMIDYVAQHTIKIKESLVESYYQKAVDVNSKHVEELKKYQKKIEEQPKHLKHILKNMEDERKSLEPTVKQIAVIIKEGDAYAEQTLSELNNRLQIFLNVMHAYEAICQINTENIKLVRRLKHRQNKQANKHPLNKPLAPSPICGSLKEFHYEIIKQLTVFRDKYIKELLILIEVRDNNYSASVASHNKKLKDISMRQYKGIMYDILKLQDDFIHFKEHLNEFNITQTSNDTKNNLERIEQILNGLEEDVHKYGQHCVESNYKRHSTTSIPGIVPTASAAFFRPTPNMMKHDHKNLKTIDELTQLKIEEIKNEVLSNLTNIFKALDEHLLYYSINIVDPNSVINATNSEDIADIKRAQEALIELKSIIPQPLFDKIQMLRQNSQEILAQAVKAKENFDFKFKGIDLLP